MQIFRVQSRAARNSTRPGAAVTALVVALGALTACSSSTSSVSGTAPSPASTVAPAPTSVAADPATTEPATSEPATTEPATTVPATTGANEASSTDPATAASAATGTATTVAATPLTVQQLLDLGRPIVLAHAGGEDQHPHSTPYAYAESVAAGVDMLDFDVQLTADGELVVQHDDSTGRTADRDLVVANSSYADLAALDNAYWFTADCTCTGRPDAAYLLRGMRTGAVTPLAGYSPDDFTIPRFEDIVTRSANMALNIEIKGTGAPAIAAAYELARILTDEHRLANAVVTSFDDTVVDAFHALAPSVEVTPGLSVSSDWILNGKPLPAGMRILQLPPEFNGIQVLTPATIAASHAAGYVIWVWPNDRSYENPDGYARLLAMGLDGLNINVPDQGVEAVTTFVG